MPTDSTEPLLGRNETMEIQRTGYRAYLFGQPFTANPYKRESPESIERQTACFHGYAAFKTDRARANRAAAAADPTGTNTIDVS